MCAIELIDLKRIEDKNSKYLLTYFKHYYSNNTNHIYVMKVYASKRNTNYYTGVLRTGSMGHLSKSPTTISKISSNFGKIGLKKMLGGVVLPPRTLFSPGVSFSQWTSQ